MDPYKYIITNTGKPDSFDPLDADNWQNMPMARMLYLTPIEISSEDEIVSTILQHFSYSQNENQMTWKVKQGLKYTDGTIIETEDVLVALLRMLHKTPNFPVIKDIIGKDDWLKEKFPLLQVPKGIKIINDTITIKFNKKITHPYFRFCLELFSIIPKRCIDLKTSKILCKRPPGSGHYELISSGDNKWIFQVRNKNNKIHGKIVPEKIQFIYKLPNAFESSEEIDSRTVVYGREDLYDKKTIQSLKRRYGIKYLAASAISLFQLNPQVKPFDDNSCRKIFSEYLRKNLRELNQGTMDIQASLFPKILPGYIDPHNLQYNLSLKEKKTMPRKIQQSFFEMA